MIRNEQLPELSRKTTFKNFEQQNFSKHVKNSDQTNFRNSVLSVFADYKILATWKKTPEKSNV